ncbi:hypothetical protein ACYZTX_29015 [Pseudomonas sp. MDT1-17]
MECIGKVLALIGLACVLMACSDTENNSAVMSGDTTLSRPVLNPGERVGINVKQVKRVVSKRNILGESTVSIVMGSNSPNLFELTLLRSNIRTGYSVNSERFSRPEILLSTLWYGSRFIQSNQHRTAVNLTMESINSQEAVIHVSGTLVNPATGEYLTLSPSIISVQGAYLKELVAEK